MITISDALNGYLNNTTRLEGQYVRIDIRTKTGTSYSISDDELRGGTIKIEKKSVSGSSFDIGECYINNISLTIIDKENKYSGNFNNAEMNVYFGVVNDSLGLNEEIQLGKFIIPTDTTIRKIASIQLVGDSVLSKLDLATNGVTTSGTPYALVSWCCEMCGVELAITEDEFNALSRNTKFTFYISEGSSISTYRDIVMYISQIIGGFATDTNDGKLTFKVYKSNNKVFNINNDTIASSKLGDSSYKLNGLSIVFNDKIIYAHGDANSDYLLELESNPLLDNLAEDLVKMICNNIWLQLKDLTFRSFDFQYNGNPAIECGDILSNDVRGFSSFITNISWVYHKKSSVTGAFLDKRTKTRSQGIKKASTTGGGSSSNELAIIRYINTEEYKLGALETKVLQEYFNIPANVSPLFSFVMIMKTELTGLVSLRIIYDNVEVLLKPRYQCSLGYHTLSFTKSLDPAEVDMLHSLSVYATFAEDSGQSIGAVTPCLVEAYGIEANIIGYKLSSGKPEWTGRYELTDEVPLISLPNVINVLGFNDSVQNAPIDEPAAVDHNVWNLTSQGSYGFTKNGNVWTSDNVGINSSSATATWEIILDEDTNYTIPYSVSCESNYDKFTLTLDNTEIASNISGSVSKSYNGVLKVGKHTVTATYTKDGSSSSGADTATVTLYTPDELLNLPISDYYTAKQAVLKGSCVLRDNSSAKDGKDIDYIGIYPDNCATWTITMSADKTANIYVKAASSGSRYLNVYIDKTLVGEDIEVNSGSYTRGVEYLVSSDFSLTAGSHTVEVSRGTNHQDDYAPLTDYIRVEYKR